MLEIVPYDPQWPAAYAAEAARIHAALGVMALRIEHNGSTAVPGLAAKPVIDIQVSVATLEPIDAFRGPLQSIGYVHLPHADDSFCPFFHRPHDWPHTHHVHVVQAGGREERRTLAFRDYLRDHAAVAAEYAELKMRVAREFNASGKRSHDAYAGAKSAFIERVIGEALRSGYPRDPW